METYRCAYRDPHSPLTPLTPISDITLRKTFRDHSLSLIPITKITLNQCPTPKRKRSAVALTKNKSSPNNPPCAVKIELTATKTPEEDKAAKKSSYLLNLRKILTPNSRPTPKSIDLSPRFGNQKSSPTSSSKRSRFTCFKNSPSNERPNSPRVLKILQDIGQEKYSDIFRKEEIDLDVFRLLTKGDLVKLGVDQENDIQVILKAAQLD
ncbi:ankyrin repeat and SAM domain-containing protein 6-like [Episyrphus balteatus]|uniref:ankyrin repeat and SAM domain-containing protein 6-like n=1 Tax=Episyrphus balteatus TaxID=286459 RepID=UPI0024855CEC|nr:ankyrin repeat and SAM domain-containing protein 6-like [Episyrphus balteatus]